MVRRGRKRLLDGYKRREILAILAVGGSREVAANYVGCSIQTIQNTADRDPAFAEKLRKKEQNVEINYLENIRQAAISTLRVTGMVLWIIFGATLFVGFYVVNGGQEFVNDAIAGTGLGPYGVLVLMMVILVILGMFLDWVGILLLAVPIFIPLLKTMSFDGVFGLPGVAPDEMALWFGVVYMVNMQMSFISPPFDYALFYLKSVAPPGVTMGQIYRSSLPFLFLQAVGLAICIIFPEVVLWLPRQVYG